MNLQHPFLTPQQKADDLIKSESDPIFFIFNRLWTWNGETQTIMPFGSGYPLDYQTKMKKMILDIISVVRSGRIGVDKPDWHILKSRQTGLTWTISAILTYCFLFIPNFSAILTSQSDNKLDNSNYEDPNTFIGKINFMVEHLPSHLKPKDKDILRSNKNYQFLAQGSSIKADSGISPARSTQVMFHAGDEWAEQEFDTLKLSALREAVKGPNVLFSTPNGMDNSFYTIWKNAKDGNSSSYNLETYHWKEKMSSEVWEEYRKMKLRDYNGDIGMFNRNLELSFEGLVTGERTFNMFQDSHILSMTPELDKEIKAGNIMIVLDFGYYAPALLISKTVTRAIIFGIVLGLGKHPDEHGKMIKQELTKWNIDIAKVRVWGDPSGVSKSRETPIPGATSFSLYATALQISPNHKMTIHPAINKVIEGIQAVNGEFFNNKLYVLDTCTEVIQGLRQAVYPVDDAGKPEADKYLLAHPFIDVIDTVRYAAMQTKNINPTRVEQFYEPGGLGMGNVSGYEEEML